VTWNYGAGGAPNTLLILRSPHYRGRLIVHRNILLFLTTLCVAATFQAAYADADRSAIDRGRYLVTIGSCNDCHTPLFAESAGKVDEAEWLVGVPIGYQGPWGTSYATNLRRSVQRMSEQEFIARARSELLPPMPWFSLRDMSDADVAAIYQFIRSLGPAGEEMPAYVAPGGKINTPYYVFVPVEDDAPAVSTGE
jgi:mono/diheme cytochrome c family protein